jgi:chromosome partitioning protein
MIILIGSEKGGVGKSTMATNISVYLALKGKDVILVDADRQGTSSVWADDRDKTELKQIESVSKFGNIRPTLEALQARYEYVVVDSQGRDSEELRTGLMAADLCITPVRPSQADLDTIYKIEYLVDTAKSFNQKLETLCVITQAPNTSTEIRDAQLALSTYEKINTIKSIVYERRVYRDALGSGHGVLEMKDTKAMQEMNAVCQEIFKW